MADDGWVDHLAVVSEFRRLVDEPAKRHAVAPYSLTLNPRPLFSSQLANRVGMKTQQRDG